MTPLTAKIPDHVALMLVLRMVAAFELTPQYLDRAPLDHRRWRIENYQAPTRSLMLICELCRVRHLMSVPVFVEEKAPVFEPLGIIRDFEEVLRVTGSRAPEFETLVPEKFCAVLAIGRCCVCRERWGLVHFQELKR